MNILQILEEVKKQAISPEEALLHLQKEPFQNLDFAKIDHHRLLRQGFSEIIYGEGKSSGQILVIAKEMLAAKTKTVLVTRLDQEKAADIHKEIDLDYEPISRTGIIGQIPEPSGNGVVAIVTAGTSDQAVAEEAARTAIALGNRIERIYDVGISGLHRLMASLDSLLQARVIIVIAGMEGALATAVGGLVSAPVIAVPTSVGYGASFAGLAALLGMLSSCSAGISVVNIDSGFAAAFAASRINHLDN